MTSGGSSGRSDEVVELAGLDPGVHLGTGEEHDTAGGVVAVSGTTFRVRQSAKEFWNPSRIPVRPSRTAV
jgi:hypothetical protein